MLVDIVLRKGGTRQPTQPSARLAGWLLAACCCGVSIGSAPAGAQAQARRHITASPRGVKGVTASAGRSVAQAALLKSLCQGSGDLQDVREYDGSLGQTRLFVDQHKDPVGRIAASQPCSGTLISRDLFLTAGHCTDSISVGSSMVDFNYEKLPGSSDTAETTRARILGVVEDGRSERNLDYAIFQLENNPGDTFGSAVIEEFRPAEDHLLTIIQHPQGEPKQVEVGHAHSYTEDSMIYYDLDTERGSSGSGILDDAGRLIGVHTGGGCVPNDPNQGVRMDRIIAVSATVRGLLPATQGAREATVSRLEVQEFGAPPVSATEAIDAEVITWLQGFGDERFAFNLRAGTDANTHQGMFEQLRRAFGENLPVRVEYDREAHRTNRILRVFRTHQTPGFQFQPVDLKQFR